MLVILISTFNIFLFFSFYINHAHSQYDILVEPLSDNTVRIEFSDEYIAFIKDKYGIRSFVSRNLSSKKYNIITENDDGTVTIFEPRYIFEGEQIPYDAQSDIGKIASEQFYLPTVVRVELNKDSFCSGKKKAIVYNGINNVNFPNNSCNKYIEKITYKLQTAEELEQSRIIVNPMVGGKGGKNIPIGIGSDLDHLCKELGYDYFDAESVQFSSTSPQNNQSFQTYLKLLDNRPINQQGPYLKAVKCLKFTKALNTSEEKKIYKNFLKSRLKNKLRYSSKESTLKLLSDVQARKKELQDPEINQLAAEADKLMNVLTDIIDGESQIEVKARGSISASSASSASIPLSFYTDKRRLSYYRQLLHNRAEDSFDAFLKNYHNDRGVMEKILRELFMVLAMGENKNRDLYISKLEKILNHPDIERDLFLGNGHFKFVRSTPRKGVLGNIFNLVDENIISGSFIDVISQLLKDLMEDNEQEDVSYAQKLYSTVATSSTMANLQKDGGGKTVVEDNLELGADEIAFIQQRDKITIPAMKKLIVPNKGGSIIPRMSIAMSGGGYRAMLGSMGCFEALQKLGLLDASTYAAATSGSTWFLGMYLRSMIKNISYDQMKNNLFENLQKGLVSLTEEQIAALLKYAVDIKLTHGEFQIADLWGAINVIHSSAKKGEDTYSLLTENFAEMRSLLKNRQDMPFPLFTALITGLKDNTYGDCNQNPFEERSIALGGRIPIQYIGSKCDKGQLVKDKTYPEYPLTRTLGQDSTAFNLALYDILKSYIDQLKDGLTKWTLEEIISLLPKNERLLSSPIYNYTQGMDPEKCPYSDQEFINEADDGISLVNIPFSPLLQETKRNNNIILVCDESSDVTNDDPRNDPEMKEAASWAQEKKIPFPDITNPTVVAKNFAIYESANDSKVPTIIKFNVPDSYSTLKFEYDKQESAKLYEDMYNLVMAHFDDVVKAIQRKSQQLLPTIL